MYSGLCSLRANSIGSPKLDPSKSFVIAKLTPNVTSIVSVAEAAAEGGAGAVVTSSGLHSTVISASGSTRRKSTCSTSPVRR